MTDTLIGTMSPRRALTTLLVLFAAAHAAFAQPAPAQTAAERSEALAREAAGAIDARQYARAHTLLDSAIRLDPKQISFRYEKSFVYLLERDYQRALATIEPLLGDTSAADFYYQLAAAIHGARGDTSRAAEVLRAGLARFPSSGRLHTDLGAIDEAAGRIDSALAHYERGMRGAPAWPDNYFRAGLILMHSSEPLWGIIYGEIFMNIERQTERTTTMSALLLETYRRVIRVSGDTTLALSFSRSNTTMTAAGLNRPEWLYEMTALQALALADSCRAQGVTIACLNQLRTEFTRRWFEQKHNEKLASTLFDWHKLLTELGRFEQYNYWLLGAGDPEEFYAWVEQKPDEFDLFQKWFRVNGMVLR